MLPTFPASFHRTANIKQTLIEKNEANIVAEGRDLKSGGDAMARLGKLLKKPLLRFTPDAIIRYFMYLPLNFIPAVGTVIFLILQGRKFGPLSHARYFQLKRMSNHQQSEFVEQRRGAYTRSVVFVNVSEHY